MIFILKSWRKKVRRNLMRIKEFRLVKVKEFGRSCIR